MADDIDLTTSWWMRLLGDGIYAIFECSDRFEARSVPGASMGLSGAPHADLNCIVIWGAAEEPGAILSEWSAHCDAKSLPFIALLGPEVADSLRPVAEGLGLAHAAMFPVMVCPAGAFRWVETPGVEVVRVTHASQISEYVAPVAAAFALDTINTARALPIELMRGPVVNGWIARRHGEAAGSVLTSIHGDHVGIWAMGTHPDHQHKGVGLALLTFAMEHYRRNHPELRAIFLGATSAGQPLYEKIGYRTRFEAQAWVRGETAQA